MRKPPIFLDKPIAGAMIRQTDRHTDRQTDRQTDSISLLIFAAKNFITNAFFRAHCVRGFSTAVVRFFACAERAVGR